MELTYPMNSQRPRVSIVLPTYNRARFLPQAFASIRSQTFPDWELIVVDDGSTDGTQELIAQLVGDIPQPVRYVHQANQGAAAARNTGINLAAGNYLAFFDSDDLWLPHHVQNCVVALDAHPDIDWVFAACRCVVHATGQVVAPNTFYVDGQPRPLLKLRARETNGLRIIEDPAVVSCAIQHGLYCGLQCSVMRARLFEHQRLPNYEVGEDQVVVIRSLKAGYRFAYYDRVHVIYHVHGENSSGASQNSSLEKQLRVHRAVVRGFQEMQAQLALTARERQALMRRLSTELFWHIGYSLLWQNGRRTEALSVFRQGLKLWPTNWRYWKTYLLARLKIAMRGRSPVPECFVDR